MNWQVPDAILKILCVALKNVPLLVCCSVIFLLTFLLIIIYIVFFLFLHRIVLRHF